jgi:hypothetical protein
MNVLLPPSTSLCFAKAGQVDLTLYACTEKRRINAHVERKKDHRARG